MLTAVRIKNGASRANGYTANAGLGKAAENGPVLVYGPALGQETGTPDTGLSKGLTVTLVTITGLFGLATGFALGYVVRGPKRE